VARGDQAKRELEKLAANVRTSLGHVDSDPLFGALRRHAYVHAVLDDHRVPKGQWAAVTNKGSILCNVRRKGSVEEWQHVVAHCLLHLGFGHHREQGDARAWNLACDLVVERFLEARRFGRRPLDYDLDVTAAGSTELALYDDLVLRGVPQDYAGDLVFEFVEPWWEATDWSAVFAAGLRRAVVRAVDVAGGAVVDGQAKPLRPTQRARQWFLASYPLLGSLAASFRLIDDPELCRRLDVRVAAISAEAREIYVNPTAGLSTEEWRFVMAHEFLHVGLRHEVRARGRDPYLWNIACDYAINQWLVELGVGTMPAGLLLDAELKGMSAEEIYDRIVKDIRRYRRLATLRGVGLPDFFGDRPPDWWLHGEGVTLDEWYRSALAQGLDLHYERGRGLVPAGLVEEIQAQAQPPFPWDVELARWFDSFFTPPERRRTYARPSRRQQATPEIPRPRVVPADGWADGRTFGVVLDTSGSMDRVTLARALGTVAGYCVSREVPAVRVVFCDAAAYDAGYLEADAIAGRVRVRGRGGTVLQPGVDLLERADDFPDDGPILLITDTYCDHVRLQHEHAYVIPFGTRLPFRPRGPVFTMPPSKAED
jgi:predicted metal-dependent peptidase